MTICPSSSGVNFSLKIKNLISQTFLFWHIASLSILISSTEVLPPIVFHHVFSWGDPDTVLQLMMLS